MTEALRRPLDMLSACLSAGRTFHVLEKGRPWAGFHRIHQAATLNGYCIIRVCTVEIHGAELADCLILIHQDKYSFLEDFRI
jgi:hypothetical protein